MQKTILCYVRKSIITNDSTPSPARQRSTIEHCPRLQGYKLIWYEDLDISGRYEANRPGWQQLLADLDNTPNVAGVAVESYDRSHRNVKEFLGFYDDILQPRGLTLISALENLDLATADGRALATIMMAYSERESRIASERMSRTIHYLKYEKRRHVGRNPFGCDRDPETKHLVPTTRQYLYNPATNEARALIEAPGPGWELRGYHDALRAAYELYSAGNLSYQEIADALNAAGWRLWSNGRTDPKPFTRITARSILARCMVYAGYLPTGSMGQIDGAGEANHAPILPPELCYAVRDTMRRRSIDVGPGHSRFGSHIYLLTGVLFCGRCDTAMNGQNDNKGGRYYKHRHKQPDCSQKMIRVEYLERQVIERLGRLYERQEIILELAAQHRTEAEARASAGPTLADLERKRAELERLIDLRTDGLITKEQFVTRQRRLQGEIAGLEAQINVPAWVDDAERIFDDMRGLAGVETLTAAEPAVQTMIIHTFFERLEVEEREIVRWMPYPEVADIWALVI